MNSTRWLIVSRRARRGLLSAALAAGLSAAATPARAHEQVPAAPQAGPVLLAGGDLYTVSHGVLPATDLLFADGKITAIGKGLAAPAGATVIDVRGQRVYPGLIAPQTTLGLTEIGAVRATNDFREVGGFTPEVLAATAYNPDSELLPTVRNHGITTVQVSPQGGLVAGRSFLAHLDGWTREDTAVRPIDGLAINWPDVGVVNAWWMRLSPEEQKRQNEEDRQRLRQIFADARAYDLARRQDPALPVDLRYEAMRPAIAATMPVYVRADDARQIVEAVAFASELQLRLVLVGGADAHLVAPLLRERNVPVILGPTLALPERSDDGYDQPFHLPAQLHEAGVRFCLSAGGATDQRNLPFHAGQAVAFGLPEDEALKAITLSAAEILGIADHEGSLDVGKDATLFVSRGDVLDTLTQQVTRVFIQGRSTDLDDRQKALERKYRAKPPALPARSP